MAVRRGAPMSILQQNWKKTTYSVDVLSPWTVFQISDLFFNNTLTACGFLIIFKIATLVIK